MSDWTRAHASGLAETAMKAGLTPDVAPLALEVGARMLAHGFTSAELDAMILWAYQQDAARLTSGRRPMRAYPRTCEVLRQLGYDPDAVIADSLDETGCTILGRHADGRLLPLGAEAPELSRVSWSGRDAWARVREALAEDARNQS